MKIFSLSSVLTFSAVASAAFAAPQQARLRRDVSELVDAAALDSVPPVTEYLPADASTELPAAVRGEQGYEYRTVRRLKLRHRNRRDVSHLQHSAEPARQYLPPARQYLPPTVAAPTPAAVAAPADDTEVVVSAAEPKVARDYLPPVEESVVSTEAPLAETEAPAVVEQQPDVRVADVPAGELKEDGYHYQQPEETPVELKEATPEYLPPLDEAVVVEGPINGESTALTKEGYQYRAIRRYRF